MHAPRSRLAIPAALVLAMAAAAASAQTLNANSASYNAGYARTAGQENQAVSSSLRDANGNLVAVNGVIQSSASASAFSGGAGGASTGAGSAGATAIGNSLTVVTQGDYNTVIVDSHQTNTGTVTATASTDGASHGP
jgi:holdfast attachment protein HfaA